MQNTWQVTLIWRSEIALRLLDLDTICRKDLS